MVFAVTPKTLFKSKVANTRLQTIPLARNIFNISVFIKWH